METTSSPRPGRDKSVFAGVALLAVGAAAGVVASRVHVTFGDHVASAAPPAGSPASAPGSAMQPSMPPPSPAQVQDARAISRTFIQVAEQLKPSVVAILVEKGGGSSPKRGSGGPGRQRFRELPEGFEEFQRFFGGGDGPMPRQQGAGSGFVIDTRGYIVTNNHVIEGADVIKVKFSDGHEARAKVTGTDEKTDVAVIQVEGESNLVAARFGDSDRLQPGEWVMAVGNPYGFDHTVTVGVISAKARNIGAGPYDDFLQTDAAINPGNSGGPLINLDGEVVGVNSIIKGVGTMIGFSIPSNMAKALSKQLMDSGTVRRPYLGISMQDMTPDLQKSLGPSAPAKGALVRQVGDSAPAAKAGIQPGDVITRVNGQPVDGSKALQRVVLAGSIGQTMKLDVWRDGKPIQIAAVTGENPDGKKDRDGDAGGGAEGQARLGIALQTLTPQLAERAGVNERKGAVITEVEPGSPAAEAGLAEGDVIVQIDGTAVATADDAKRALAAQRPGGHQLRVTRRDGRLFLIVP